MGGYKVYRSIVEAVKEVRLKEPFTGCPKSPKNGINFKSKGN